MMKWEENLKEWFMKHAVLFGYLAVAALGVFLRYSYLPMLSSDLEFMNASWFEAVKAGGMGAVLAPELLYTYSPLHLYVWTIAAKLFGAFDTHMVLKAVSFGMEAVLLVACFVLICRLTKNSLRRFLGFALLCINPILIWNVAGWGQTDAGFAGMCVLAVLLLADEKPEWGLAALGVALAWKLQAIFVLPLFMYAWFQGRKKFSILWFLLVPAIWVGSGIPMIAVGASPLFALEIYFGQTGMYTQITYNAPNLYAIMGEAVGRKPMIDGMVSRTGMAMVITLLGGLAVWMMHRRIELRDRDVIVLLGAWCTFVCMFFLPRMHERYAIVGELLLVCWAVWSLKPKAFVYVVLSTLPTLSAYAEYLFKKPFFPLQLGGVMNLILVMILTWEVVQAIRTQPRKA